MLMFDRQILGFCFFFFPHLNGLKLAKGFEKIVVMIQKG